MHMLRPAVHSAGIVAFAACVDHRPVGIELLPLLVVIGNLYISALADDAAVGLQLSHQHTQQSRFTGTVWADETDPVSPEHTQRQVAHDRVLAERLAYFVG